MFIGPALESKTITEQRITRKHVLYKVHVWTGECTQQISLRNVEKISGGARQLFQY